MVLAVELDNAKISFGIFNEEVMSCKFDMSADIRKTSDEYLILAHSMFCSLGIKPEDIDGAAISSVVPQLTDVIVDVIKKLAGNIKIVVLGIGCKTGFPIKVDNPSELGGDIVANAAAVSSMFGAGAKAPCVIIDMGTASTVFAMNGRGEFVGGAIIAGMGMSVDSLHDSTAQIPSVGIVPPIKAIGKNTRDSVRSGIIFGNAFMIDGFIDRFCDEMGVNSAEVFITGDYANAVIPACTHKMQYIPNLTLLGLYCIYKNNIR